jgi:hypothetical protein
MLGRVEDDNRIQGMIDQQQVSAKSDMCLFVCLHIIFLDGSNIFDSFWHPQWVAGIAMANEALTVVICPNVFVPNYPPPHRAGGFPHPG